MCSWLLWITAAPPVICSTQRVCFQAARQLLFLYMHRGTFTDAAAAHTRPSEDPEHHIVSGISHQTLTMPTLTMTATPTDTGCDGDTDDRTDAGRIKATWKPF